MNEKPICHALYALVAAETLAGNSPLDIVSPATLCALLSWNDANGEYAELAPADLAECFALQLRYAYGPVRRMLHGRNTFGVLCYAYDINGMAIFDPTMSSCGRFAVDPCQEYGLTPGEVEALADANAGRDLYAVDTDAGAAAVDSFYIHARG
jgi:hypothetical protein